MRAVIEEELRLPYLARHHDEFSFVIGLEANCVDL